MVKSGSAFVSEKIIPDSPNKVLIRRNLIYNTVLNKLHIMNLTLFVSVRPSPLYIRVCFTKCVRKDDKGNGGFGGQKNLGTLLL